LGDGGSVDCFYVGGWGGGRLRRRHFERWCMGHVFNVFIRFRENEHKWRSRGLSMGTAGVNEWNQRGKNPSRWTAVWIHDWILVDTHLEGISKEWIYRKRMFSVGKYHSITWRPLERRRLLRLRCNAASCFGPVTTSEEQQVKRARSNN